MNVYVAHEGFVDELCHELDDIQFASGLLIVAANNQTPVFALDIWYDPVLTTIESIGDAAKQLKSVRRLWCAHIGECVRRTLLIAKKLSPCKKFAALSFPPPSLPAVGEFTLLDEAHLLYATKRAKIVPSGVYHFIEDKYNPPNRAYLKLWEALAVLGHYPKTNDRVLDLGAAPGGWSYVLSTFGASVIAIDKAPLDEKISGRANVETRQQSAFALSPNDFDHLDWFVCDMACYPEKLYRYLLPWIESNKVKQFIVTIKLQGKTDFATLELFKKIPGGKVMHLSQNKHEATFFYPFST